MPKKRAKKKATKDWTIVSRCKCGCDGYPVHWVSGATAKQGLRMLRREPNAEDLDPVAIFQGLHMNVLPY